MEEKCKEGEEGKSKVIATFSYLEGKLVGLANSVETFGVD